MTAESAMSLEEFERHTPGVLKGRRQAMLLALEPLAPTRIERETEAPVANLRSQVMNCWAGRSGGVTHSVRSQKRGTLRTNIVDGELWVCWYPADSDDD